MALVLSLAAQTDDAEAALALIHCVAPSAIMNDRMAKAPAEKLREIAAGFPLGRIGVPEDVAQATLYLVSEASSWITGATLDISGGRVIV